MLQTTKTLAALSERQGLDSKLATAISGGSRILKREFQYANKARLSALAKGSGGMLPKKILDF